MHRSNFRPRARVTSVRQDPPKNGRVPDADITAIKEQIANVSARLTPLTASVARLAAPQEDISVPKDIAQSLRALHSRLDKLEKNQQEVETQTRRMATAFSNAILKLAEKVEKISGGEDSSFSLAHSLEKLATLLASRKFRIVRDNDGNISRLETESHN